MKYWGFLFLLISLKTLTFGQCFTIESVLADACGDPEGENEMVTLRVNENLDINNLVFDWPSNNFLGWCPAPAKTNQLNQTIISSCGFLLEPINGIVPAGESILVVSSVNMMVSANSFEGLTDTVYIIYQCAGNTSGHFSNLASTPRTLAVAYNGACISAQTVSYLPTNLPGGDGGAIFYDTLGIPTYYNTGCNAPLPGLNPYWSFPDAICEDYGILDLNTFLTGNATIGGTWTGDVENNNSFNPAGKLGLYTITYTVEDTNSCLGIADSTLQLVVEAPRIGRDTIEACDSIRQFGVWIFSDTLIEVNLENPNPFLCDSIVQRFYKITNANYSVNPSEVTLNSGDAFDFQLSNPSIEYEFWNQQGDTCFFPCSINEIRPENMGTYTLRISDSLSGCAQFLTIEVNLIFNSSLNIPNVFTPNNDGTNDTYKLFGKDLNFVNYQIYSRWGELIFEGNSINATWDGTFRNQDLESQFFLMKLKASGKDGRNFDQTVKIRLIR